LLQKLYANATTVGMIKMQTESVLQNWRYGQVQAERLSSELLIIEGFNGIDPQSPLGGRDGLKDVICYRAGNKWIAACYFPTTLVEFKDVKEKFSHDLEGLSKNNAEGLAFFVNQHLTPGERAELIKKVHPKLSEIYHLERIRVLLDAPKGYGLRFEYLRIPMNEEEQLSFWSSMKDDITKHFLTQEHSISELHKKLDLIMERTMAIQVDLTSQRSSFVDPGYELASDWISFPTAYISVGQLLWIHRLLTDESSLPEFNRGTFRNIGVWIGTPDSSPEKARFTPPPPDQILSLTEELLKQWRSDYLTLVKTETQAVIKRLAQFHHGFLSIHPFLDANGRVARAILQQQIIELLNRRLTAKFSNEPGVYFACLRQADSGNIMPLVTLITACLE
jgi:fido (protein-threonine AMPylation protein)